MIGETIKGFHVVARLGKGGMGEVFVAEQPIVKTKVAIKLLLAEISTDTQQVERFFNEAIAAARIQHAGIVKIFDVGFVPEVGDDKRAFLIMEYLQGMTLSARIRQGGRLPLARVAELGRQIASVLAATHAAGIVHRDLKPDNLFLVADSELASGERVKILDFGIAKLGTTSGMTATGGAMGTPAYMAPEQWTNAAKADARADVYALGCVIYEMCAGRTPFSAATIGEACAQHLTDIPAPLRTHVPAIPAQLDALIASMLAKDPAARPSVAEVERAFVALASAAATSGMDATLPPSASGAALAATAGTVTPAAAASGTPPSASSSVPAVPAVATTTAPRERARRPVALVAGLAVAIGGVGAYFAFTKARRDVPVIVVRRDGTLDAAPSSPDAAPSPDAAAPPADGMIRIAGGSFDMGTSPTEAAAAKAWCATFAPAYCAERAALVEEQEPFHHVTVATFDLDAREASRAALVAWLQAEAPAIKDNAVVARDNTVLGAIGAGTGIRRDASGKLAVDGDGDLPAIGVTWAGARRFCAARGARLPTDAEWEYAARGASHRRFAWGDDDPTCASAVFGHHALESWKACPGSAEPARVSRDPGRDVTPDGVRDLAGNVSEWVDGTTGARDRDCAAGELRVARGGSYLALPDQLRAARRMYVCPTERAPDLGVRCAK